MMHAQKLDKNNNSTINRDELTMRQDRRFANLDRDENGMIEKHEFNARFFTVFHRMDRDGDEVLRGDELLGHSRGSKKLQHGNKA